MSRFVALLVWFSFTSTIALPQCIDKSKIDFGGDYGFVDYIFHCPTYSFSYKGDTSKKWGILNNPIDISQAPAIALKYKKMVEDSIRSYAGSSFFSNVEFEDVEIVYPEKFKDFSGRHDVTQSTCRAKYFYNFQFKADSIKGYLIGVAVDKKGKIISPFNFPSKRFYKPIDKTFTYCKLIDIARRAQKNMDPINKISLEYDKRQGHFYWLISQAVNPTHEGENYYNQVVIDAADLTTVKKIRAVALVEF